MPDNLPAQKCIFFPANTGIVYYQGYAFMVAPVADDAAMFKPIGETPVDHISPLPQVGVAGMVKRQALAMPLKETHLIGHAAVVDIGVRTLQTPELRIFAEMSLHILMDQNLQVDAGVTISPYHHIGAGPAIRGYIAPG